MQNNKDNYRRQYHQGTTRGPCVTAKRALKNIFYTHFECFFNALNNCITNFMAPKIQIASQNKIQKFS